MQRPIDGSKLAMLENLTEEHTSRSNDGGSEQRVPDISPVGLDPEPSTNAFNLKPHGVPDMNKMMSTPLRTKENLIVPIQVSANTMARRRGSMKAHAKERLTANCVID